MRKATLPMKKCEILDRKLTKLMCIFGCQRLAYVLVSCETNDPNDVPTITFQVPLDAKMLLNENVNSLNITLLLDPIVALYFWRYLCGTLGFHFFLDFLEHLWPNPRLKFDQPVIIQNLFSPFQEQKLWRVASYLCQFCIIYFCIENSSRFCRHLTTISSRAAMISVSADR